ncbi:Protein IMPACT-A [Colletotrichum siamense]|uniref:Protein IMPACT-A n=1 Tax=Colletotrichum siamense TaxID=690259 RepID=UPI001872DC43|nr:Protein IMPACT-A [Colletotrichum siamense]KAF5484463.1 Protein IMPACT-A [Colletotrichum siamense]
MASQQDLQDLLRLITARKVPMMTAMSQVKALQAVNLRSIQQIADALPDVVEGALGDSKTARSLQSACKSHLKRPGNKRAGDAPTSRPDRKRPRNDPGASSSIESEQQSTGQEDALALPVITDEEGLEGVSIYTNRAPVMLAFAIELLRFTMPEQPLSSRLSLAQAVVSINSRSKAASLGFNDSIPEGVSWGEGQPKVTVMGRSITVLKRGDYHARSVHEVAVPTAIATANARLTMNAPSQMSVDKSITGPSRWTTSTQVTLKSSTFVARVSTLEQPSQVSGILHSLLTSEPSLQTATHNAWGYRLYQGDRDGDGNGDTREGCEDDGETGCGEFILRLMRETEATGAIVVLSRWYGGEMLGPDRWRLMRTCVIEALSDRLRLSQSSAGHDGAAVWALDLQHLASNPARNSNSSQGHDGCDRSVGVAIHRPESARAYLLKSFASGPSSQGNSKGGKTGSKSRLAAKEESEAELRQNLGKLLGALRLLFESWAPQISPQEMDRRAWQFYVRVRPDVELGPSGWGAKGWLNLNSILQLRYQEKSEKA